MIPYFQYNSIIFGPVTVQVWGLFVATGIIAGTFLSLHFAKKYFLSAAVLLDMAIWSLVGAFIFARVFHVVFYSLDYYLLNPADVFKIWQGGASSLGGFFGAGAALWLFAKKRQFSLKELLPYFDIMTPGFWLGWGIGRIGCFFIHDHPGILSNFWLAVNLPEGARFDLGLLDSLLGFILSAICYLLFAKLIKIRWGLVFSAGILGYALARFFLDFLRATDVPAADARYAHLTPAQWGMAVIIIGLTFGLILGKMAKREKD